jgi:uncharacterized protein GlcG (DUF336 family)
MAGPALALDEKPVLSLDIAERMAAACADYQAENDLPPLNIAVMDDGGNLKLFHRQDGAFLGSIGNAVEKAQTSAWYPFSTREVEALAFGSDGEAAPLPGLAHIDGVVAFAGGLPVIAGDHHIGSIGVSGGSADQDEACAKAALDAVSEDLAM